MQGSSGLLSTLIEEPFSLWIGLGLLYAGGTRTNGLSWGYETTRMGMTQIDGDAGLGWGRRELWTRRFASR